MFKLTVKKGNYGYNDGVFGNYDYVVETEDAVEAIKEFLDNVQSEDSFDGEKVTLRFKTSKKKKGRK